MVDASRATGVNTFTTEGLAEALEGVETLIDVTNSGLLRRAARERVLLRLDAQPADLRAAAGVRHHVALSVVGTERLARTEGGYFAAKAIQEKLIRDSGRPYTIVHGTQFFEFVQSIADSATIGQHGPAVARVHPADRGRRHRRPRSRGRPSANRVTASSSSPAPSGSGSRRSCATELRPGRPARGRRRPARAVLRHPARGGRAAPGRRRDARAARAFHDWLDDHARGGYAMPDHAQPDDFEYPDEAGYPDGRGFLDEGTAAERPRPAGVRARPARASRATPRSPSSTTQRADLPRAARRGSRSPSCTSCATAGVVTITSTYVEASVRGRGIATDVHRPRARRAARRGVEDRRRMPRGPPVHRTPPGVRRPARLRFCTPSVGRLGIPCKRSSVRDRRRVGLKHDESHRPRHQVPHRGLPEAGAEATRPHREDRSRSPITARPATSAPAGSTGCGR